MSARIYTALVTLSLAAAAALLAEPAPLPSPAIPNAGFEEGGDALTGWTFSLGEGGAGSWAWETARVHSGKRALQMRKTNAVGYSMLASGFIPVQPGTDYEVAAWVSVRGRSRASIYFMVSQYSAGSDEWRLPNAFSTPQPCYTGDGWKELRLRFHVREGSTRVRIHALASQAPITIIWDDFELRPASSQPYSPRYERPAPEPLPPLEPARARLMARKRAVAIRRIVDGRPRLLVDGRPVEPAFYVSPFHNPQDAQIADFQRAGVRVYLVPLTLGRGVYSDQGPWTGPGQTDFSMVDDRLWRVLRCDPDAYILFYLATDPYREWGDEHPTEVCTDQDGKKAVVQMHPRDWGRVPRPEARERYAPSLVSSVLRRETTAVIRALVRHVNASLPGKAVIGYHVAGLNDGQFFQWARLEPGDLHLADYSDASQRAFRDWLRRRYHGDVAALRGAWHRPNVTFETAQIPPGHRRTAPGFLLDPRHDQDVADYNRFYSEGTVETIHTYARAIKEETKGQALVGTYWEDAAANVDSHLATGRMLQSPHIDFLAGPAAYGVRMAGEVGECHSTWGSILLHGRVYLTEQDWRSWLADPISAEYDHDVGRAENAADHNAMVRRETGMMLAYGHGTWWYDMGGGWFHNDQIMRAIAEARRAFARDLHTAGRPKADVAVFISERSLDYLAFPAAGPFRYDGIVKQLFALNQSGVPYHLYLQSDLASPALPDYRLYIFLNAHHIAPDEAAAIKRLRRNAKTLVFVHAPGVVGAPDPEAAIHALTGIRVRRIAGDTRLVAEVAPTAGRLAADGVLTIGSLTGPAFAADDPKAIAVGTYPGGQTAVAARDFGTWKSVFFGPVGMSESFINAVARWAGAWVVSAPGDAVYANQHFLTIHALWDSPKELTLCRPSRVVDLTTGRLVAGRTTRLAFPMRRGETRWFALTSP